MSAETPDFVVQSVLAAAYGAKVTLAVDDVDNYEALIREVDNLGWYTGLQEVTRDLPEFGDRWFGARWKAGGTLEAFSEWGLECRSNWRPSQLLILPEAMSALVKTRAGVVIDIGEGAKVLRYDATGALVDPDGVLTGLAAANEATADPKVTGRAANLSKDLFEAASALSGPREIGGRRFESFADFFHAIAGGPMPADHAITTVARALIAHVADAQALDDEWGSGLFSSIGEDDWRSVLHVAGEIVGEMDPSEAEVTHAIAALSARAEHEEDEEDDR